MKRNSVVAQRDRLCSQRSGSMLIDVVLSLIIGTTVLTLAVNLVHQTMRFASASRQHAVTMHTLTRLEFQFREDIHRATEAQVESENSLQTTSSSGERVRYVQEQNSVLREIYKGDEVIQREVYQFAENIKAEFRREPGAPTQVSMTLTSSNDSGNGARLHEQIVSIVSREQILFDKPINRDGDGEAE